MENNLEAKFICLPSDAFEQLVERLYTRLKDKEQSGGPKWVPPETAMQQLNISSPTTLQKLRDDPKSGIRISQLSRKIILYDRDSINEYLERKSRK